MDSIGIIIILMIIAMFGTAQVNKYYEHQEKMQCPTTQIEKSNDQNK